MTQIIGQKFFTSQKLCLASYPNGNFFMKLTNTSFTAFNSRDNFIDWFRKYKKVCDSSKKSIQFYEVIRNDLANAFYADIEAYAENELTPSEALEIQTKIIASVEKNMRVRVPRVSRKGAWTEDHRPDTKKDGYRYKISMHVIFNDLVFDDSSRNGPMHMLASEINHLVMKDLRENGGPLVNSLYIPDNDILDMAVYRLNGCMRGPFASKSDNANEFFKPIGEFTNIGDYLITKEFPISDIPSDLLVRIEPDEKNTIHKRTIPRKVKHINPEEQTETQRVITKHLKTWGDTSSSVSLSDPDSNGCMRFYVRGPTRVCPPCGGKAHDGNGASVTDLGSGNYSYKCLYPLDPKKDTFKFYIPGDNPKRAKKMKKVYMETLLGIKERGIVVKAPMGSGKTYRTMEFIKSMGDDISVLWVTPRKSLAMKVKGDLPEFAIYTEEIDRRLQVVEYESIYKISRGYDIIILDEIRSLTKSMVSTKTNGDRLEEHMEFLVDLCRLSKHTLMLDADIHIDGAVKTFMDHVFGAEPVHEIIHHGGSMELDNVYVNSGEIITRMLKDLKDGKRIMLCCGSSKRLEAIEHEASKVVGKEKVGTYHAKSQIQSELLDVNLNWTKYQFIGFTSTITCSISYEGVIDRVYVIPAERTASPREMAQMIARARKITGRQVIIESRTDNLYPLNPDLTALYEEKLGELLRKRQLMIKARDPAERAYISTIKRKPTRNGMIYTPNILTRLGAWNMVEEYLKEYFWQNEFIRVIMYKNFTWRMDEYNPIKEDPNMDVNVENEEAVKKTKTFIQITEIKTLDLTDACELDHGVIPDILKKKTRNIASPGELVIYRKYEVQRYFNLPLNGSQVIEFERNKKGIVNLILMNRMDDLFWKKLYLNEEEMGLLPEFGKSDLYAISLLKECLLWYGVNDIADTRTPLDFEKNGDCVKPILDKIDKMSTTRKRATGLKKRLINHLEYYTGMTVHTKKIWNSELKKRVPVHTLQVLYPDWLLESTVLGSDKWIRQKFESYDRFIKAIVGTEYQTNKAKRTLLDFCNKYKKVDANPFARFAYVPS